jgi:hypothetical protein
MIPTILTIAPPFNEDAVLIVNQNALASAIGHANRARPYAIRVGATKPDYIKQPRALGALATLEIAFEIAHPVVTGTANLAWFNRVHEFFS